ncbi:MAG TPA: nitroreductase family deazaflavin-dependent oxidoreductase, partial [Tepidiformaceae bacterium]|nr:nitroreductase family deazaflavin-dependent oxidoreductase [Tepidiformaceae bacterium]
MLSPKDADLDYCYLTTTGRTSGEPREIEIWFGADGGRLYLLSGGRDRSHWVRNIKVEPRVTVRLGSETYPATARLVEAGTEEDAQARRRLLEKYSPRYSGDLTDWGRTALPVALDL